MSLLWQFIRRHPNLLAWLALSIGMVAMLLYAAKDEPLLPTQRAFLALATVALAGLCVWIINWE
jgi:hypothetical protein